MKIVCFLLLFSIYCSSLQAIDAVEPPWFEIEILIFEQSNQTRLDSEQWDQQLALPDTSESIDFLTEDPSLNALDALCLAGIHIPELEIIPETKIIDAAEMVSEPSLITDDLLIQQPESLEPPIEEPPMAEQPYVILPDSSNQLNDLKTRLQRKRGYQPLLHISWRQPVENLKKSQWIRLFSGKNYSKTFNPEGDVRIDIATVDPEQQLHSSSNELLQEDMLLDVPVNLGSVSANTMFTELEAEKSIAEYFKKCQQQFNQIPEKQHPDVWQLDGNIKIYVKRYLHLVTDLSLRILGKKELQLGAIETSLAADRLLSSLQMDSEVTDRGFGWQLSDDFLLNDQQDPTIIQDTLNKYLMRQSRRIRSNEIHYIDHPLFGLLIQIRPYEKQQTENDDIQANN